MGLPRLFIILIQAGEKANISLIRKYLQKENKLRYKTENWVVESSKFNIELNKVISCSLGQWSGPFLPIIQSHIPVLPTLLNYTTLYCTVLYSILLNCTMF